MKLLVLLTASFPYESGEEFLINEINYISGFDKVLICPYNLKAGSKVTKSLPPRVECIPLKRVDGGQAAYAKLLVQPCVLSEIGMLLQTGRFSSGRVHEALFFMKHAVEIADALKQIPILYQADQICIYSYWFYDAAAAAALLKKDLIKHGIQVTQISRAHGFDIHQDRSKYAYLPMRGYLLKQVDGLYPCSKNGEDTIISQYPQYANKIHCAYLGTADHGEKHGSRNSFHTLSCSGMVPVKRLHLIAQALSKADFDVYWTHIGSGPLSDEIKNMAAKLPDCVKTEFTGQMDNAAIMNYYKTNHIAACINVSSSEGIPVSIMEACSFGIPIIATDVGGTSEAVVEGKNGFLLPPNFTPESLLEKLRILKELPEEEYAILCENSRETWAKKFSAQNNYKNFYEVINL